MSITQLGPNQKLMKEGVIVFPENSEPYIAASRCKACGRLHFPATPLCTDCFSEEMEPAGLSREGKIYSLVTVHLGVKGFQAPYLLAWVDIDGSQSRLAAQVDWDPARADELHHGQKVVLRVGVLRQGEDGQDIVGYKFKPVFEEE